MEKLVIEGGRPLKGNIRISGSKNAAVGIIIACLLIEDTVTLENVPLITDVFVELDILKHMGASVKWVGTDKVEINATNARQGSSPNDLVGKMRASYYLVGAELGRFGKASVGGPGGCTFCDRPIDQHIKAFKSLGATVNDVNNTGRFVATTEDGLIGNKFRFDSITVGGTINAIIAAVKAKGETIILNPAREPHVVDLANFLVQCGANVIGAGSNKIKIIGVDKLHGCTYSISPDMIEAGTYMVAAAATGGELRISNIIPKHLECIYEKLEEMGVEVTVNSDDKSENIEGDEYIIVKASDVLRSVNISTLEYPGFPTDMQSQICVLLCLADGVSKLTEAVWSTRFGYVSQLVEMGADIELEENGKTAIVRGGGTLVGKKVKAVDLRAGAALIIAGLVAQGSTEIAGVSYIDRGYEDIVGKLSAVGASIRLVETPDEDIVDSKD